VGSTRTTSNDGCSPSAGAGSDGLSAAGGTAACWDAVGSVGDVTGAVVVAVSPVALELADGAVAGWLASAGATAADDPESGIAAGASVFGGCAAAVVATASGSAVAAAVPSAAGLAVGLPLGDSAASSVEAPAPAAAMGSDGAGAADGLSVADTAESALGSSEGPLAALLSPEGCAAGAESAGGCWTAACSGGASGLRARLRTSATIATAAIASPNHRERFTEPRNLPGTEPLR